MQTKKIIFPINTIIIFLFFILISQKCESSRTIIQYDVGVAFSATDKYDRSTQQIINGIHTAKIFFEKKHPKYRINLIRYTFRPNDMASVAKVSHQICKDAIPIVIGGEMSEDALMLGRILNSCHVVIVSPTATNPNVTKNKPYVFQISYSDKDVAKKLADFTYHHFKAPIIGVIDDVSLPYPDFLTKSFLNDYSHVSHNTILVKKVLREDIDYSSEIDDFIKNHVKIVVMLTYDIDFKRFSFQAAEKNYFPIYIGSDGWGSNESIVKLMRNNSLYQKQFVGYRNNYWKDDGYSELAIKFKEIYRAQYYNNPDAWNAIGFDSAWLVFTSLSHDNVNINSEKIRNRIANTHNLQLLTTSNFEFKPDNTPVKDLYIYKLTAAGATYVTMLKGSKS